MFKKLMAIVIIATVFFFNFNTILAEEENIMEGETEVVDVVTPTETESDKETANVVPAETTETEVPTKEVSEETPVTREAETPNGEVNEPAEEPETEEPTIGKVIVKIIDSRTGDAVTTIELLADATSNTAVTLKDIYPTMSYNATNKFYINETLYLHKFLGFFDAAEGGNQIVFSYNNTAYPELKTITCNATQTSTANYKLNLRANSDLTTEKTVNIYARFETTAKPNGKTTINVIDSRTGNVVDSLITYATDTGTNSDNSKSLTSFFPNLYVSGTRLEDILDNKKYVFKGFFTDLDGETQITKSFTPGEAYPELKTLKTSADLSTSTWRNLKLQVLSNSTNTDDKTYNIYALWDEKPSTTLTIVFKELSESGAELNDTQNEVSLSVTNVIELGNSQTQRSVKLKVTEFISGNYRYIVDGWYEEDGVTPVPSSMYVNGDPLQIAVPYKCTEDSPKELTLTYILKWNEYLNPVYEFNVVDEVSNGNHHWDNTDGHFGEYTYTFKEPASKEHYEFLYYKMDDTTKKAGEKYGHDITAQGYGTEVEETFNAWWRADVTLILLDGSTELGRGSNFDGITISDVLESNPEKIGYNFLGWTDENGTDVDASTVYNPEDPSTKPTPKEVKLYAKWEQIMIDITVTKTWDDSDDNDKIRPDSVTVNLMNGNETVETVELSEDNKWTYTFNVPQFDDKAEIAYTVEEKEVEGYTTEINGTLEDGFVITNTHAVETVKVSVTKVWDDKDNYNGMRPETVMVVLLADGEEVDSTLLSEENGWTYTFEAAKNADGKEIEYTIKEVEVENYWVEVEGNMTDGFTITNTYFGEGGNDDPIPEPEPETTPSSNPKTGDNIYTYIAMLLISLFGLIKTTFAYRKNN